MDVLGMNLNYPVSQFLDPLHGIELIQVCKNLGHTIDIEGVTKIKYGDPVVVEAQIQDPNDNHQQWTSKLNDNTVAKVFYINYLAKQMDRLNEHGGDLIIYENSYWYVVATPDNFPKQGWVCALAYQLVDLEDVEVDFSDDSFVTFAGGVLFLNDAIDESSIQEESFFEYRAGVVYLKDEIDPGVLQKYFSYAPTTVYVKDSLLENRP